MIRLLFHILFSVLLFASHLTGQNLISPELTKEVSKIIKYDTGIELFPEEGILVIVLDQEDVYVANYGSFADTSLDSIMYCTSFQMGGLSKTFTALAIDELIKKGQIDRSTLVSDILEDWKGIESLKEITIGMLLTHSSGLAKVPNNLGHNQVASNPYAHYTETDFQEYLATYPHGAKSIYMYSHLNYIILGQIYQVMSGQAIETWMPSLKLNTLEEMCDPKRAKGFDRSERPCKSWEAGIYTSALGFWATPYELLSWIKMQIHNRSIQNLHQRKIQTHYNRKIYSGDAWHILDYEKYPIFMHSGRAGGHHAFMGFIKETQTGVIIISNCQKGTEDLGNLVLRMVNKNWKRKKYGQKK